MKYVSDLRQIDGFLQVLWFPPPIKLTTMIYTHYIHSVVVQDFVLGRACFVMRLVHATGKTWYKVLYQHTMYVISLSNISIKTNFKQITRVKVKFIQYSEGDYISCMTSRYFVVHSTMPRYCVFSHIPMIWCHD
jgi:hypothetical protein